MNHHIEATTSTPDVLFDETLGTLEFSGQSYPEDSLPFYSRIQTGIEDYLQRTDGPLTLIFKLDYFNTSSSKCLLNLFESMEKHHSQKGNIQVKWYYKPDDEDMHDSGIDFSLDVMLPFEFIELE
jgi:hypothetical protein